MASMAQRRLEAFLKGSKLDIAYVRKFGPGKVHVVIGELPLYKGSPARPKLVGRQKIHEVYSHCGLGMARSVTESLEDKKVCTVYIGHPLKGPKYIAKFTLELVE